MEQDTSAGVVRYKVTGPAGESVHGGEWRYDLPTRHDDGGQVCRLVDRTNLAAIDHWEAIVTTERSTRYDDHYWESAGEPDSVPVWREEARAAPWERALVWSAIALFGLATWYGAIVLAASVWRRVF